MRDNGQMLAGARWACDEKCKDCAEQAKGFVLVDNKYEPFCTNCSIARLQAFDKKE